MKSKFVTVKNDSHWGYGHFIVLQVEETDKKLLDAGLNIGYKIIINARHKMVGAAGGNEFIPSHGSRTRKVSKKIDTTEADVLGFYLTSVKNIYDIPDVLDTESFWDIVFTDWDKDGQIDDFTNDCYYKVLYDGQEHIGSNIDYKSYRLSIGFVDMKTLKMEYSFSTSDNEGMIAKYNWLPNEPITEKDWDKVRELKKQYDLDVL